MSCTLLYFVYLWVVLSKNFYRVCPPSNVSPSGSLYIYRWLIKLFRKTYRLINFQSSDNEGFLKPYVYFITFCFLFYLFRLTVCWEMTFPHTGFGSGLLLTLINWSRTSLNVKCAPKFMRLAKFIILLLSLFWGLFRESWKGRPSLGCLWLLKKPFPRQELKRFGKCFC